MVNFKSATVQKHKDLSDKIKESLLVEDTSIKEKESHSAYFDNLPEGVDKKSVEEISKYNGKFITAAHVAIGEIAADIFSKNKKAEEVNAEIGFFGKTDSVAVNVAREKTYTNHLAENGASEEITKALVMKTTVTTQSAKGYGLKSVRASMSEEFSDLFKK